jgi:hypothetical protein
LKLEQNTTKKIKKIQKNSLLFFYVCIEYNQENLEQKKKYQNIQLKGVKK